MTRDQKLFGNYINIWACFQRSFIYLTDFAYLRFPREWEDTPTYALCIYAYKWASNLYLRFYNFIDFSALSGKAPWTADGFPRQCINIYTKFGLVLVMLSLWVSVSFGLALCSTSCWGVCFSCFLGSSADFRLAQLADQAFIFYAASTAVNYDSPCVFLGFGQRKLNVVSTSGLINNALPVGLPGAACPGLKYSRGFKMLDGHVI